MFGGIVVTLAVTLRPHHATLSPLFWFGVALLGIAGIAYLLSIGDRLRSGPPISHGLIPKDHQVVAEWDEKAGVAHLRIGLQLLNNTDLALRFQAVEFTVQITDAASPLLADQSPVIEVPPRQTKGWFRDPLDVALADLPVPVSVSFRFVYGQFGRKRMTRSVEGAIESRIPRIDREGDYGGFIRETEPARDERLPRR